MAEEVRGYVIGGAYVKYQIFYDSRPQSGYCYDESSEGALEQARRRIDQLRKEFKCFPCYLYQNDTLWEIRTWPGYGAPTHKEQRS